MRTRVPLGARSSTAARSPTMKASRYVDIFGVGAKRISFVPSLAGVSASGMVLDTAVSSDGMRRVSSKVALAAGSSQQGKARRASVASNWVAAMLRSAPSASV